MSIEAQQTVLRSALAGGTVALFMADGTECERQPTAPENTLHATQTGRAGPVIWFGADGVEVMRLNPPYEFHGGRTEHLTVGQSVTVSLTYPTHTTTLVEQ